ncbi:hypothetical protein BB561_003736 [Smittium simulii]|uniref:Homeobox domain-containing protein n=1 Tax=Smittium simulii TaxID=133385 RepID=A0A2T9YJU0_9FUNG|nr:hypothetical protein BB561_003736 [Smittium simulii]
MNSTPIWQRRNEKFDNNFNKNLSINEHPSYSNPQYHHQYSQNSPNGSPYRHSISVSSAHTPYHPAKRHASLFHFPSSTTQINSSKSSISTALPPSVVSHNSVPPEYRDSSYNCYSNPYNFEHNRHDYYKNRNSYINMLLAQKRPMYSFAYKQQRRRHNKREIQILEAAFTKNSLPDKDEKNRICQQTGLSPKSVRIWFQNKRQAIKRLTTESNKGSAEQSPISKSEDQIEPLKETRKRAASEHELAYYLNNNKDSTSPKSQYSDRIANNGYNTNGNVNGLGFSNFSNVNKNNFHEISGHEKPMPPHRENFKSTISLDRYSVEPRYKSGYSINHNDPKSHPYDIRTSLPSLNYNESTVNGKFISKPLPNQIFNATDGLRN